MEISSLKQKNVTALCNRTQPEKNNYLPVIDALLRLNQPCLKKALHLINYVKDTHKLIVCFTAGRGH